MATAATLTSQYPRHAERDLSRVRRVDPEQSAQLDKGDVAECVSLPHLPNPGVADPCASVRVAASAPFRFGVSPVPDSCCAIVMGKMLMSPLSLSIRGVVGVGSRKDVRGVAARRVVAGVQPVRLRPLAVRQEIRNAVGRPLTATDAEPAVSPGVLRAQKRPTCVGAAGSINLYPETILDSTAPVHRTAGSATKNPRHTDRGATVNTKSVRIGLHSADLLDRSVGCRAGADSSQRPAFCCPIIAERGQ